MSQRLLAFVLASFVLALSSVPASAGPSTQLDPVVAEALELIRSTSYGRILVARNDDLTYRFDEVWNRRGGAASGVYQHWNRTVVLNEDLREWPLAAVAFIIAHELGHAQSARAGRYLWGEECLQEEIDAEGVAAQWWRSKYGRTGNPLDNEIVWHLNIVAGLLSDDATNGTDWFAGYVRWYRADDCGVSRIKPAPTPTPTPLPTPGTAATYEARIAALERLVAELEQRIRELERRLR